MKTGEIFDTIYIKDGEKLQVTCKVISFDKTTNTITLEPLTVVLEDIASYVSDLPIDDRTKPEPPVITTDKPLIDDLTKIEMELWSKTYIATIVEAENASEVACAKGMANIAIDEFRESFGISIEPIETPE